MSDLPNLKSPEVLIKIIQDLHEHRKRNKITAKRKTLSAKERKEVLEKADSRCHVCGVLISGQFQADHVKCHSSGGDHNIANYLPSCTVCNRYRWHYSSEEIQWILKFGVWARRELKNNTGLGVLIAKSYIAHDVQTIKRRKSAKHI